ncbi:hypothetical protein E1091_09600, partial [Micromonospora fluostatini]
RVIGQWQGGFQGEVTVRNTGAAGIAGWRVGLTLPAGSQLTQAWNAEVTGTGSTVTARNVGWNGSLAAGATTTFGYLGNGSPGTPTLTCTAS